MNIESDNESIKRRAGLLPVGFRITSVDNTIAQNENRLGFSETLVWSHESQNWKKAVTGMEMMGLNLPSHMFVSRAGDTPVGKHYSWDRERRLWIEMPNPPMPPPEGASLSPTLPGFAYVLTAQGEKMYQWNADEQKWIQVARVPWGYSDGYGPRVRGRYEAALLDDTRIRIYWDGKRKSWIDVDTEKSPKTRPPPPLPAEIVGFYEQGDYNRGNMAKATRESKYFLWSKEKQRWILLSDPPPGFHRGENPNEAFLSDGSALDSWLVWDNAKEAWVEFGPARKLEIHGKIG